MSTTNADWRSRIVEFIPDCDPEQLLANPFNPRRHPGAQRDAMRSILDEVGIVAPVISNRTTGHLIDGHMRVEEAITKGVPVPVVVVELSELEEKQVLAKFDPVAYVANYDGGAMSDLLADLGQQTDPTLDRLLSALATPEPSFEPNVDPDNTGWDPGSFEDGEKALADKTAPVATGRTEVTCPNCLSDFEI